MPNPDDRNSEPSIANPVIAKPITDVLSWTRENLDCSRLFLPPIQRSVVWRNSQIINYWDSLLRGYPAGLMMIHSSNSGTHRQARNSDGITCEICEGDFQLFDGQQRLTAILLGLGQGQLKDRLKLWVDLGSETPSNSDLRFVLRISSTGQPFGYQAQSPNEKQPLQRRRDMAEEWMKRSKVVRFKSQEAFKKAEGSDLIDASCAVPLKEIIDLVQLGSEEVVRDLQSRYPLIKEGLLNAFVEAISKALSLPILFQLIDPTVIEREAEYIRFFGRLGQGGTALSNDELTYSIIKHHFPEVHDRMKEITDGDAGKVASEVNLILAALRVAKVNSPWNNTGDWQIFGRPNPAFVSRLRNELLEVREEFERMIPVLPGGRLKELLEFIRQRLVYDRETNQSGLPVILLARLPHQLVDVLILMESQRNQQQEPSVSLPTFVLYWLLFVRDSNKAADIIFRRFCLKEAGWQPNSDMELIRKLEELGIARRLPDLKLLGAAREEINLGTHLLRSWGDRFAALDANKEQPSGDALRSISNRPELIKCALMWLQREYLSAQFHDFDPTSSRDEDLPIDLDHLIPGTKFSWDWRDKKKLLGFSDEKENFRKLRGLVGNSLGNYRWLDASVNRSRQDGMIEMTDSERDSIDEVPIWNALIKKSLWSENDVTAFQKIIDLRSIAVYEKLLDQGGLNAFVTTTE